MSNNLTKKQVGTVKVDVLNTRYCWLMKKGEEMPAGVITYSDMKELLWIEDELRGRLIKFIGHDFYPPDRVEEKTLPKNYIKSILEPIIKPELKPGIKIKFMVTVISSIGSKAAQFKVEADSKDEVDILARNMIRKLGLQGATHKIS